MFIAKFQPFFCFEALFGSYGPFMIWRDFVLFFMKRKPTFGTIRASVNHFERFLHLNALKFYFQQHLVRGLVWVALPGHEGLLKIGENGQNQIFLRLTQNGWECAPVIIKALVELCQSKF